MHIFGVASNNVWSVFEFSRNLLTSKFKTLDRWRSDEVVAQNVK